VTTEIVTRRGPRRCWHKPSYISTGLERGRELDIATRPRPGGRMDEAKWRGRRGQAGEVAEAKLAGSPRPSWRCRRGQAGAVAEAGWRGRRGHYNRRDRRSELARSPRRKSETVRVRIATDPPRFPRHRAPAGLLPAQRILSLENASSTQVSPDLRSSQACVLCFFHVRAAKTGETAEAEIGRNRRRTTLAKAPYCTPIPGAGALPPRRQKFRRKFRRLA